MTGKADFTQEQWDLILEGPPSAGIIVLTAQRGGTFRESIAMAKACEVQGVAEEEVEVSTGIGSGGDRLFGGRAGRD